MALFFSADIHQGNERFSVHSRGKQCAFMSLSALLTARNIPLNFWSRITFKNALLQGDKMFLNALDSGLIILDPAVEFLSVEHLPTVVNTGRNDRFALSLQGCKSFANLETKIMDENIHLHDCTKER